MPAKEGGEPLRVDMRVSICPYYYGEKVVIRFLSKEKFPFSLEDIMGGETLKTARQWLKRPYGLIMVTGPTGSGKTTTLYLMLLELARKEGLNILSIEDPIEYLLPGVNQMQIMPSLGLTFNTALPFMMRQDPDVICVGEIRDPETANLIFKIAQTGHLVLTQLHTTDSASTLRLLSELGLPAHSFGHLLIGSISQRLIRKLCPHCKKSLAPEELKLVPLMYREANEQLFQPAGCEKCSQTGYLGRAARYEVFESSHEFWNSRKLEAMIATRPASLDRQNSPFFKEGLKLLNAGLTSWTEVERISSF